MELAEIGRGRSEVFVIPEKETLVRITALLPRAVAAVEPLTLPLLLLLLPLPPRLPSR